MAAGCQTGTMVCHQQVFVLFCLNLLSFFYFLPFFKYLFQTYEQLGGETRHKGKNSDENLNSLSWNSKSIFYNAVNNLPKLKLYFSSTFCLATVHPPGVLFQPNLRCGDAAALWYSRVLGGGDSGWYEQLCVKLRSRLSPEEPKIKSGMSGLELELSW